MLGRRAAPLLALFAIAALPEPTAFAPCVPEPGAVIGASTAAVPTRVAPTVTSAPSRPRKEALEEGEDEEKRPERWVDIDTGPPGTGHLGTSATQTLPPPAGDDRIVNQGYFGLQSETAIAVNSAGTVLVAGFNDPAGFDLNPVQLSGVARSIDGGQTWIASGPLPCPAGGQLIGDPDVKYDPTGDRFFFSSIYTDPATSNQAMCVHRSDASGLTWSGPYLVPAASAAGTSADKEMIAVNTATGRLIIAWLQIVSSTFVRNLTTSYSDDGGLTWSPSVTVASNTGIVAPQVRFVPGPNATATAYVAYTQGSSIRIARSVDGGSTWGTPVVLRSSIPALDEVTGFDRAVLMSAMDLDPATGKVYVTWPAPDANGTPDIELVSGSGVTFSAPIRIDSNPGSDRAQLRPAIAVDASTHRVHVTWYDQDGATSGGDRTELMHAFSDDAGVTWSRPTPLFDRPFHAAYGDDGGEPNLGDYNECVAQAGVLHAVAGATKDKVRFDDAQPKASMGAVDTYHDRRPQAPAPGFNLLARADVVTGTSPSWVETADLDGDGDRDLVTSNVSNAVTVRMGNGAGDFGAATTYAVAGGPYAVALGDLNHDGRPDIVTANSSAGSVSVLLNAGNGTFGAATSFASGSGTAGVAIGDVNGDSHPDLVAANYSANHVAVLLGNGSGGFGAATTFATANGPNWVRLADLDGNGTLDMAVAASSGNVVTVRLGDGLGGFGAAAHFATGSGPTTLAIADLNGDGKLDVVTANFFANTLSLLPGNGAGGFGVRTDLATAQTPGSVAVGDLDADGVPDLAVSHDTPSANVSVLRGLGAGSFAVATLFTVASNNWGVHVADVSGDGILDLLSANHGAGSVTVLLGRGSAAADYAVASLRLASLAIADCGGPGGRLDPGETGSLTFTLRNYVANPVCSPLTYTNVRATLSSPTPGVVVRVADQAFANVAPLASVGNAVPFRVSLDPGFVPGTDVELLLTVRTDQGIARLRRRVPTGSPGAAVTLIDESFDAVAPPALPGGWTTVYTQGNNNPWVTSTTLPGVGAGSQAAYHPNAGAMGWNRLWSPAVIVPTPPAGTECTVTLDFDIAWALENDPAKKVLAFDGCYLRIHDLTGGAYTVRSINAGAFVDEFRVGTQEGYTHRFARGTTYGTQDVWSGSSLGQKHVSMTFPGAGMTGHTIQLRFEFQEDANGTCTGAGLAGPCGVAIDNVLLRYVPTVSAPCSPVAVSEPGPVSFGIRGMWPNPSANGALTVRFSLPSAAGARLEMFDVTGRVVRRRELDALGAGTHTLTLGEGAPIAPGVYFVRLRKGTLHQTSRAVVLR
jgi:hypothetical protein